MRNLIEYPITLGEIEECLRRVAADIAVEGAIGDMRPTLLEAAAKIIGRVGFVTFDIIEPVLSSRQKLRIRKKAVGPRRSTLASPASN